jgi:hypothetical protein
MEKIIQRSWEETLTGTEGANLSATTSDESLR